MKAIKFSILGLVLGTASISSAFAQNVEQIYMKSGSVVEGYISEQIPGQKITIQSIKATIVANSDSLLNRVTERIPLESLSVEWREWAEENNKYIEVNGLRQLDLTTLEFHNCKFSNVYLLEKGAIMKFLDLTPNRYEFVWGDMYRSVKSKRPVNLFSGVKEVLVLDNNSIVVGQIIEQFPGKDLKILTENGEVLSFKFSQVKQIKTEKLTEGMSLWSQIQLLDRIKVKGETSELTGFISSRTLGKELVIDFEDGSTRTIQQNQIISYAKIPNDKYIEVYDKMLNVGDVLLNGEYAYFVELQSEGPYLVLGEIVSAQYSKGQQVCLEAKLSDINAPITLVKAHIENITKHVGRKVESFPWPVVTYQDFVQSAFPIQREITPLGNIKVEFCLKEIGDYVLNMQGNNEYIVINVIENE